MTPSLVSRTREFAPAPVTIYKAGLTAWMGGIACPPPPRCAKTIAGNTVKTNKSRSVLMVEAYNIQETPQGNSSATVLRPKSKAMRGPGEYLGRRPRGARAAGPLLSDTPRICPWVIATVGLD